MGDFSNVGVITVDDSGQMATSVMSSSSSESEEALLVKQRCFEWQMNEVLRHPRVLELRYAHGDGQTAFAVVLWETIRLVCARPHLRIPPNAEEIEHPIIEALLNANILAPRWGPTRLVLAASDTRERLL